MHIDRALWVGVLVGVVATWCGGGGGMCAVTVICAFGWCLFVSRWRLAKIEELLTAPLAQSTPAKISWLTSKRIASIIRAIVHLQVRCDLTRGQDIRRSEEEPRHIYPGTEDAIWSDGVACLSGIEGVGGATIITADRTNGLVIRGPLGESTQYRQVVERLYGRHLRVGEGNPSGVHDGALSRAVFGEFVELGFRYALVHPLRWESGGAKKCGLAWVGFSADRPPGERSIEGFYRVVARLHESLRVLEAVAEVSRRAHEAEDSDARKSEFLAHISHDIRSPLNTVRAILSLLKAECVHHRSTESIEIALRNCDGVGELVEDILDFTRYKEGRLQPRSEVVPVRQIVDEVVQSFELAVHEKRLEILVVDSVDRMEVEFDRRHLRRILSNLVGNAIKYTDRGKIQIELANEGDRSVLIIEDSGVGMTSVEVAHLFTPFSRFAHERVEGVGLGLTVAKALLEANGGSIRVDSKPHVGSRFTVCFGRSAQPSLNHARPGAVSLKSETSSEGRLPTVLLVDDDRDSCISLARALSGFPVETLVATTVPEGMSLFNFAAPDVVVTDLGMPLGGGERLIEYVQASGRRTPIYCLSGSDDPAHVLEHGVRGVFQKPVDVRALWCAIEGSGMNR